MILYVSEKEATVVPAHKKNFKGEPSNYRPISLLSVVGKLLEQVVASFICHHLRENRFSQTGNLASGLATQQRTSSLYFSRAARMPWMKARILFWGPWILLGFLIGSGTRGSWKSFAQMVSRAICLSCSRTTCKGKPSE